MIEHGLARRPQAGADDAGEAHASEKMPEDGIGWGHPQTLFLFLGADGRRHCKLVRKADADRWLRARERYREFRRNLRQLRALNQREEQILVALMERRAVEYS